MRTFSFIVAFIFSTIQQGNAIKCYACEAHSFQNPNACKSPSEITCKIPFDRCAIMNFTMQVDIGGGNIIRTNSEIRNCTVSLACNEATKEKMCQSANISGALKECEYSCCQGDLCNTGVGPQPTFAPIPQAKNLSCYECGPEGMGPNGTGEALISCDAPRERNCGTLAPGVPFDRCMTVKMSIKNPKTGAILNQEMKNCSFAMMCNEAGKQQICQLANSTGQVTECDFSCCQGDLCSIDVTPQPTFPTDLPGPQPSLSPNPSAKNLSCYECSPEGMGPNGTGEALISCDAPRERKCGEFAPGMPYDRCMTVKMSVKNPKTGAILNQEMKNCSSNLMCQNNMVCQSGVNSTGDVVSCEATCCEGNLCNTQLTTTLVGPTAGQTALVISNVLVIISVVIALIFK